jgi:hypothetical protein
LRRPFSFDRFRTGALVLLFARPFSPPVSVPAPDAPLVAVALKRAQAVPLAPEATPGVRQAERARRAPEQARAALPAVAASRPEARRVQACRSVAPADVARGAERMAAPPNAAEPVKAA